MNLVYIILILADLLTINWEWLFEIIVWFYSAIEFLSNIFDFIKFIMNLLGLIVLILKKTLFCSVI